MMTFSQMTARLPTAAIWCFGLALLVVPVDGDGYGLYPYRYEGRALANANADPKAYGQFQSWQPPCLYERLQFCSDWSLVYELRAVYQYLNLTSPDLANVSSLAQDWDVDGVREAIYGLLDSRLDTPHRNKALQLLETVAPPNSFLDALSAFTPAQRQHVLQLVQLGRYADLFAVARGIVISLPFEDQPQADRFVRILQMFLFY